MCVKNKGSNIQKIGQILRNAICGRGFHTEQYFIDKIEDANSEIFKMGTLKGFSNKIQNYFSNSENLKRMQKSEDRNLKLILSNDVDDDYEDYFKDKIESLSPDELKNFFATASIRDDSSFNWRLNYLLNKLPQEKRVALIKGLQKNDGSEEIEIPLYFAIMNLKTSITELAELVDVYKDSCQDLEKLRAKRLNFMKGLKDIDTV